MLAKRIRELRIKKGLSQEKLARLADVALNTVVKIEAGDSKHPTIQTVAGIAMALGVSLDDLARECSKDTLVYNKKVLDKYFLFDNIDVDFQYHNFRGLL